MAETLLSISEVLLFGRVMEDMAFKYQPPTEKIPDDESEIDKAPPPRPARANAMNSHLQNQLAARDPSIKPANQQFLPRFARVYGFAYEGGYYDLDAPIIMLVHGPGVPAESAACDDRAAIRPDSPDKTGAASSASSFADDIMVWSYDKADMSIRMDTLSGSIEDILLDIEIGQGMGPVSGGKVAGGKVAGGKVAGGKVAGGKVAGGKVAGGKVAGGKVSGD